MYDAWLALHAEGNGLIRLQMNFLHNQGFIAGARPTCAERQLPELRERLKNQFQFFGDDMVRTGAIGEWAAPFAAPSNPNGYAVWLEAQRLCAKARWRNENARPAARPTRTPSSRWLRPTRRWTRSSASQDLRWGLQHADHATPEQLARLKALNCGVSISGLPLDERLPRADGLPIGPIFPQIVAQRHPGRACTRTACTSRRTTRGSRCTTRPPA